MGRGALSGIRGGDHEIEATGIRPTKEQKRIDSSISLPLDPGMNVIEVIAENPYAEGRDSVRVNNLQTVAKQNALPNLYIVSIGVNGYDAPQLDNLKYAVNDAREMVKAFEAQKGNLYNQVYSRLVTDDSPLKPTREKIIDSFDFFRQASDRDTCLLFIAGHGINDSRGSYFLLPSDAVFNADGDIRSATAIPYTEIQRLMTLPGKKLIFIDTCRSGSITGRNTDNNRLVRALQDISGTTIFTASGGSESSEEIEKLKHGAFTYSIIQGMKGAADINSNKEVTMAELNAHVSNWVRTQTSNRQSPRLYAPDGDTDTPVADLK